MIPLIFAVRNFIGLSTLLNMKPNVKKMKQSSATQLWKMFKLGIVKLNCTGCRAVGSFKNQGERGVVLIQGGGKK